MVSYDGEKGNLLLREKWILDLEKLVELSLLLFSWPPVREVCPNYEVVMLQPRTGTPADLGSVADCYVAILLIPAPPFPPAT